MTLRSGQGGGSYLAVARVDAKVLVHLVGLVNHVLEECLVVVDVGGPVGGSTLDIEPKNKVRTWWEQSVRTKDKPEAIVGAVVRLQVVDHVLDLTSTISAAVAREHVDVHAVHTSDPSVGESVCTLLALYEEHFQGNVRGQVSSGAP